MPLHDTRYGPRVDSAAGWVVALSTTLATFAVFGVTYSFGAVFSAIRDEFDESRGAASLIFAITAFVYFILGAFTGRLADRFGPRIVLLVGAAFLCAGMLLTSTVDNIWLGYLYYGVGVGIGVACAYVPMVATVGAWFEKRRTAALGVAVAGIGVGTLVGAPLADWLVDDFGWRDAYVMMGVGATALMIIAAFGARRPPRTGTADALPSLASLIANARFVALFSAMLLFAAVLFVPFVFLDDYLEGYDSQGGALLIGIIGAMSVIGRLGFGAVGTRVSLMRLYQFSFTTAALSFLIWLFAESSYSALVAFTVVFGVSYGGFIALSPAIAAAVFGPVGLGGVLGALYTAAGFGGLAGPPLAGEMIDRFGYDTTIVVCLMVGLSTLPLLLVAERLHVRHQRSLVTAGPPAETAAPPAETSSPLAEPVSDEHSDQRDAEPSADAPQQPTPKSPLVVAGSGAAVDYPFDSVLIASFGGPYAPEDVRPFLAKVTDGRDVSPARLAKVEEQYRRLGGESPINRQNRDLADALGAELTKRGIDLPVYLGNRNWHPFFSETLTDMADARHHNAVCLLTSAFSSHSGCRQYTEDIEAARRDVANAPSVTRTRVYFNHPGFLNAVAARIAQAREGARIDAATPTLFTAHSLPRSMADACAYEEQLRDAAKTIAKQAGCGPYEIAYQSRSGPPTVPWLEPSVEDAIGALAARDADIMLVVPLGFVSDHMEVMYDLDVLARATARRHGITLVRARTVGCHPTFVGALADLIDEAAGVVSVRPTLGLLGPRPDVCVAGCCPRSL